MTFNMSIYSPIFTEKLNTDAEIYVHTFEIYADTLQTRRINEKKKFFFFGIIGNE